MVVSRGHTACEYCHSRKQKCDEKKPICSRCRSAGRTCVWPQLRKRGPAKGYVEALERRLRESECALLHLSAILDRKSTEHTETFSGECDMFSSAGATADWASSKGELMAVWQDYPLRNLQDVRTWAGRAVQQQPDSSLFEGAMCDGPSPVPESLGRLTSPEPLHTIEVGRPLDDTMSASSSNTGIDHLQHASPEERSGAIQPVRDTPMEEVQRTPSNNVLQLPQDFERSFIW